MAGERISEAAHKVDVVVVAARYDGRNGELRVAQAYVRRGAIWGDIVLLDRNRLMDFVRGRRRVVTGVPKRTPGDFDIGSTVKLARSDDTPVLVAEGRSSASDDLGIPAF